MSNIPGSRVIDLRSDTVTWPTPEMRKAMANAEVGDDVYGEDPTVNRLEAVAAERLGHEAGLFVPTGTQSNLLGLLAHCERGDEYIVGHLAHTYKYEGGGAAVLGSIQPQPIPFQADGSLDLAEAAAVIKPDDYHFARTRLLCLENTQGGKVLALDYLDRAQAFAREHGLGLHLDGARVFNAVVASGETLREVAREVDSLSFCLSKGLGAPAGSVLVGTREFRTRAHRLRKMLGGGMRQVGILAAAGIYALEHHVERLADDHRRARRLAETLAGLPGVSVDTAAVQTNIVMVDLRAADATDLARHCSERGVLFHALTSRRLRLVTHLDVDDAGVHRALEVIAEGLA